MTRRNLTHTFKDNYSSTPCIMSCELINIKYFFAVLKEKKIMSDSVTIQDWKMFQNLDDHYGICTGVFAFHCILRHINIHSFILIPWRTSSTLSFTPSSTNSRISFLNRFATTLRIVEPSLHLWNENLFPPRSISSCISMSIFLKLSCSVTKVENSVYLTTCTTFPYEALCRGVLLLAHLCRTQHQPSLTGFLRSL